MNLYYWRSRALANYARGHVAVMAESVEEARDKVQKALVGYFQSTHGWRFYADGTPVDSDDREWLDQMRARLSDDLAAEPTIGDVVLVEGSE